MIIRFLNNINLFLLIVIFTLVAPQINGQTLSGTKTVCSSGCDYPTISSAVNALNTNGVGTGGVTINVLAGHTETLTSGMVLSVSGTSTNPIVFQRNGTGNNPLITSFSGNKLAGSTDSIDVMWSFEGSDYVTINGIDFQENVLNTTPTSMMEVAIGFYKKSGTDGANHNEIKNCVITLNRNNFTLSSGVRSNASGSVGIEFVNATRTNLGTSIAVFSVSGASSFNKIYGNTIQNCNFGISLIGYAAPSPYTFADVNNEIGGETSLTGNAIINFGGGAGANTACGAMFIHNQWDFVIANNTVNNNTGSGQNHPNSNRGIWVFASSAGSSCDIKKNVITISGGLGTIFTNWCLSFEGAASEANGNTINIDSNQFLNCNVTSASTQTFSAIWLSTTATNVNVRNNYIYGFRFSGAGTTRVIHSELACENLNILNNRIDSVVLDGTTANGTHNNISVSSPQNTLNINNNVIRRVVLNTSGSGGKTISGIHFFGNSTINNCVGNIIDSVTRNGSTGGITFGIYQVGGYDSISAINITKNIISNFYIAGTGAVSPITGIQTTIGKITVDSNTIFNLSCQKSSGQHALIGISNFASPKNERYYKNTIYNLTNTGSGTTYGISLSSLTRLFSEISYNHIHTLHTTGLTIAGIVTQGIVTSVFNNKVYDIYSSSTGNAKVSGILILASSGTAHIYNNLIGDLRATSAITTAPSTSPTIIGINLPSTSGGAIDMSHNTVFINAVSTGTVFGTAALFHNDNFAPSSRLTLRNNILVNTSIASGSGKTVAYHRSGSTMGNFQLSSCRNLYYAGIPSANNVIFYDGTNADQTLSSYQTRVTPRDSVSFTENVSFVDTLGASSTFLKINPTIPTFVEATSTLDANVGIDFNNSSRAGFHGYSGTSGTPDLGAWEDNLTPLPINNMYLDSLNAEQTAILAPRGTTNNIVIRIPVYTRKGANALVATSFKLNTIGTTNTADISDARIFYTGANPLFNDSNLFGSVNAPSGIFNVSGSQTLITGVNYFWLTYTISATATLNNFLDARLDSITLSGIQYAPINSSPNGVLTIQSRLNGSYNIGLGQAFSSITQALIELKQLGVSGPVKFILKDTSYSNVTGENMPLVLGPYANASPTNKVTIMPDSGVNVVISGSSITTVDFNNCSHFYIDGRQGGMGGFTSGANLIIRNTDTTAPAIRFINDADSNQILYTDIRASNTSLMGFAGAGVVNFGTTDRTFGNDFNTIKLCHISGNDSLRSHVGISSIGSSSTIEAGNDNNIIDSCDIYNFSALDVGSVAGIYVGFNNSAWKIRNNRLYQTTGQYQNRGNSIYGVAIHSAYTNLTSRGGFIIHNNFIGGSDASGNGYFEINGVSSHQFHGISVSVGTGIPTSIQGNTVANIKSTGSTLRGINLIRGNVNVGTIEGNTIGSRVNNGAIQGVVNSSNTNWIGISANGDPSDSFNIANNVINGFDIHGPLSYFVPAFTGIHLTGGNNVSIWNNLIGDTIPQNASIKISSGGNGLLGYTAQVVSGILMSPTSGTPHYNVSNNTVSNLFNYQSGLNSQVSLVTNGIKLLSSIGVSVIVNISHNLIASLYTTSLSTSVLLGNSMAGVEIGSLGKCNVKNNIIRGLSISGNSPIARNWAINANLGAYNQNASINIIGNLIHTQMVWGNNPMNDIVGIQFSSSKSVVCNNMVRTGIDTLGNAIQAGAKLCGIYKVGGNSKVFNNSVYIGGSNVNNTLNNTQAFRRYQIFDTEVDSLKNNIFINERSNSLPGGPGHFALQFDDSIRINSDNNLFFADTIGKVGNIVFKSLINWRDGMSNDTNSIFGIPGFVNPNGGINTVDLRINPSNPTPIEGTGAVVTGDGTDIDFDGQLRAANTPVDIGADAGVFTLLDLAPPIINYTKLLNTTSITDRVIVATITDKSGIYTSGTLRPRVYFKKSASGIFQSTPGILTSGNGQNGSWTFTINNALLGGVTGSDSIYYFIVAQDSVASSNLGSNPGGASGTNVNNITFSPALNAYKITAIISGTFNVGIGQPFGSLTAVNGLFNHINTSILSGNITVNITSDIEEPGTIALLNTTETGIGNYNILIQPNAPVIYSITGAVGNAGAGLIRLVGAKRVTIDGRFLGTGRYLRFINRQQAGVTLLLHQEAQKDTIRNCIVEGVNNTFGIIQFGGSTVSDGIGNDSNAIIGCLIRDTLGTLATHNIANTSISCSGTIGRENDRIAILDNEMVNFGVNAINMTSSGTGNFWNISNNKIYQTITKNNLMQIVLVQGGSGHTIINNSIGGSAINRSGAAFRSTAGIIAIDITSAVGTNFPIMVSGNVISNLGVTGSTTGVSALRMAGGNLIISNNTIGGGMMPHDTIMNCYDGAIHIIGGASALVDNNLISHMNYYRASLNRNTGIHIVTSTTSPLTVQRNTIQNISGNQTGTGTTSFRPAGITVTLAPVTGLTITQNTIRNIRNFNSSAGAYLASGIFYAGGASTTPIISQNRIRNIGTVGTGTGVSAPEVSGICILSASNAVVANNQISLGDSALNQSRVYGIFDGTGGSNTYAYNSIFINGHTSAGVNHSSGFHRSTTTSSINFRNNLVYNKRTTSGTGLAYAISSTSSTNFAGANFNYNMFILNDTARLLELPSGTSIGWSAMNNLYPSTYNTNWAERSSIVAPHAIFIDTLNGNLGIDSSSSAAWYVNGKGIRIQNLSGDFNHVTGVRSTEITSGATDIGSVEFTPTSMPPIAHADKAPAANDSTRFYFASKLVAKAVWGSSGTLPSVINLRYYSGTNPVNTPTGSTFANTYYDLQALGGSGYNHNLTLMLDSAVMGSIASVNRTQIANYQGALSNWTRYANTIPSGNNGYFKVFGLTNGGAFTFTDSAFNPLPVSLNYFTAKVSGNDVLLNWQTASEKNNRGFYLERSTDGRFFNEFDFVFGKGNSNILSNYSNTDINPFTNSSILYYRLKQVDFDGNYTYSKSMMVRLDNKTLNAPIIYPNPVLTDMYVELNSPTKANISVQLTDIHGKEVYNQLIQVNDGINKIIVPEIATLHAGVYLAKIVVDGEVYTMKVIKQ